MKEADQKPVFDRDRIARCFDAALAVWGVNVNLSPPVPFEKSGAAPEADPLAYIDLSRRQIVVNFERLVGIGAGNSLIAVLAHEIGHHTRFPHSLRLAADLQVLEKRLIPNIGKSLTNLFFDLQVNEFVGRTHADDLIAVYRGFAEQSTGGMDPVFAFYLAIYEELWGLDEGALTGEAAAEMENRFPGFRAEAAVFAQTFWSLDDVFLQFTYFASRFIRYVGTPRDSRVVIPLCGDLPEPSVDDYDGALMPNPRSDRAVDDAVRRGWIDKGKAAAQDPLTVLNGLPVFGHGRGAAAFRQALVEKHYARLVESNLIEIPPDGETGGPEPSVPTSVSPWETGDDPRAIDWLQSVVSHGSLASAMPLQRDFEPDDDMSPRFDVPPIEIYLDTSGSMPNPSINLNAMTLAALVLSTSAIRKGGKVRAVVYSDGKPLLSDWFRDESAARKFLLNFAGGGTLFPFDDLELFCDDEPSAIRVVVSDDGFLEDLKRGEAGRAMSIAAARSRAFVALLLSWGGGSAIPPSVAALASSGAVKFVFVKDAAGFAAAAAALGRALFGDDSR